jgi:uncharacterized protein YcbK (DUF882 family)
MINRRSLFVGLAGAAVTLATPSLALASTQPGAQKLTIVSANSQDFASVVYKKNGRFDAGALDVLDHVMRDWRQNEMREMDRGLYDIFFEVQERVGGRKPAIVLISGYRTPKTNEMLRTKSEATGVAKTSLHLQGMAGDIRVAGVSTSNLRDTAMRVNRGGVGYYPTSGFVHVDTGPIRRW